MDYNTYLSYYYSSNYNSNKKLMTIHRQSIDLQVQPIDLQGQSISLPNYIDNIPRNDLNSTYIDGSSNPNVFLDSDMNTVIYFKTSLANQTVFIYKEYLDQSGQTLHLDLNINNIFGTAEIVHKSFSLGDNIYSVLSLQSITSSTDLSLNFTIDNSKNQIGIRITPDNNSVAGQKIYCIIKNATMNYRFSDNYFTNFGYNWVYQIGGGQDNGELQNYTENTIEVLNNILSLKLDKLANANKYNSAKMLICDDSLILDENTQIKIDVTAKMPISYDINNQIIDSSTNPIWTRISLIGREYLQNGMKWPISGEIDIMEWSPTETNMTYKTISTALYSANPNGVYVNNNTVLYSPIVTTSLYDVSENEADFMNQFHTYSVIVKNSIKAGITNTIEFYYDASLISVTPINSDILNLSNNITPLNKKNIDIYKNNVNHLKTFNNTLDNNNNIVTPNYKEYVLQINLAYGGDFTNNTPNPDFDHAIFDISNIAITKTLI